MNTISDPQLLIQDLNYKFLFPHLKIVSIQILKKLKLGNSALNFNALNLVKF